MPMRDRARWAFVILLSMALLSAPAIWNRFPLLQYDTGGYLARWYEPYLVPSRAVTYGLILNAGAVLSFWPVVLGQSALTVWVIALIMRVHGLGGRPGLLAGIVAALSVFSTLPWLTSILLTDIFAGLAVLALYLLLLRANDLNGREQAGLVALIAVSVATHSATFAVLLMLLAGSRPALARRAQPAAAAASWQRRACDCSRCSARVCRQCDRHQAADLDAGRVCALVRTHAAGWHRQEISRRALPARTPRALRLQRRIAARRGRMVLGQPAVRQARTLRRP